MFARKLVLTLVAAGALATAGCGISLAELQLEVDAARECTANADCALAGASECTCPFAVNQGHVERIDDAAGDLDCGEVTLARCDPGEPLQCLQGRCHGDAIPVR